ncbi:Putative amino acid permease [Septoria linicola]|uniref:Amino acid permease n=1 Tax=Septoria linicola TaxID=215465 RepID=A0A9Q9ARX1_9PEZI|nr:putative amino acid permease [Septoria linicola]USW51043.1 Putative amino acid permease [Septoria linicola]
MNTTAMPDNEKGYEADIHTTSSSQDGEVFTPAVEPRLMTRLGLTAESFQRRNLADKHNQLNKTMKSRHLNMIAIGGSIGAGLFVGSGSALRRGGPAGVIIAFSIIGVMIFNVVHALGELAYIYPISGGFYTYSVRFIDPAWGFAMGWNYVLQWAVVLPLELVVAGLTVAFFGLEVNNAIWITVFWVAIMLISLFGVLGYAEEEFWVSLLKLTTIIVFMFMGVIFACGGGPSSGLYGEYWGARLWYNPGAFANGFRGVCSVFVTAAFSFSGTELVGLAAAESANPQKALPSAIKQVFWRITLFYVFGLFFVGLLVPYDDDRLLGSGSLIDVSASPFVIVAINAGLPAFGTFVNVVIMVSVLSIGLSGVYGGSRTLTALAEQGYAPRFFSYVDRAGRPLWSTITIIAFGALAYVSMASSGVTVFNWLLALSGLAALFTWGSICLAHIRFRSAWAYHGHTLDEIPFKAAFGVWGSWLGLILIILVLIAQIYVAIADAYEAETPSEAASAFFLSLLAIPVVLVFYIAGFVWKRESWKSLASIDVDSGRRDLDYETFQALKAKRAAWPAWRRIIDKFV